MGIDAGWAAAIGVVGGAVATGAANALVELFKGRQQRLADKAKRSHEADEAKAQREAKAAEAAAQADRDRKTAIRAEHAAKIAEWREGLATAHREYTTWEAATRGRTQIPAHLALEPNALTATWFTSLRPLLSGDRDSHWFKVGDNVHVDDEAARVLADEIAAIERRWQSEDG